MSNKTIKNTMRSFLLLIILAGANLITIAQPHDWENPAVFGINKEPYHVPLFSFNTVDQALTYERNASPWVSLLNGKWQFKLVPNPAAVPNDFGLQSFSDNTFSTIDVPCSWQLQGFDTAIYVGDGYAFTPLNPPYVPAVFNPTGLYRTNFEVPQNWNGRQIFITFEGVESAFYIWVNGQKVGYSENSFMQAEFDVTAHLKPGSNQLSLEVLRFSDGSYLEDQDYWRLSGIFRDVYIYSVPKVHIADVSIVTDFDQLYKDAALEVVIELKNFEKTAPKNLKIQYTLFDNKKTEIISDSKPVMPVWVNGKLLFNFSQIIKAPKQWNAENPELYTLVITLLDAKGNTIETISQRVGFREVEIINGVLLVNGQRVVFKGANRHDSDPQTGRYCTREAMLRDIMLLKQFNFNAVRTSHYPNAPLWYDLCDEYGLYLIDEANLETHGLGDRFTSDSTYEAAFIDRAQSMVERDKNHPSILIWSLGNESSMGGNHEVMAQWIHQNDTTRPVHYEGANRHKMLDITSVMYPQLQEYVDMHLYDKRPAIMCEYVHAGGNGVGNMKEYVDLFYKYERLQGGFIWSWADQALNLDNQPNPDLWLKGSDNGIVFADRRVKPSMYDIKHVYQPVHIEAVELSTGKIKLTNRYMFSNLNTLKADWELLANGKTVKKGELGKINLALGKDTIIEIKIDKADLAGLNTEYLLNINFCLPEKTVYAEKNWVVATGQFILPVKNIVSDYVPANNKLKWVKTPSTIEVKTQNTSVRFNSANGQLVSYQFQEKDLIKQGPELHLWRTPTSNDKGWDNAYTIWHEQCQWDSIKVNFKSIETKEVNGAYVVMSKFEMSNLILGNIGTSTFIYTINQNGDLFIHHQVQPSIKISKLELVGIPRMGMVMQLFHDNENVTYYGAGPFENYIDRNTGARIGLYKTTVDEMYTPYLIPQSCGNRTNVRWATFTGNDSTGIGVFGLPAFEFSALNYSDSSLQKAKISDLKKEQTIYLNIDYRQRGLGNASCGPGTIEQYNVPFIGYDYDVQISPVNLKKTTPFALKSALPYLQAPVIEPLITTITNTTPIIISHSDANAQIYYTLDGSQPTKNSKLYTGAFTIDGAVKVRTLAIKNNQTSITEAVKDFDVSKVLLASQQVVFGEKAKYFEVPISDIKQIRLIQQDSDGNIGWDHADWADMKLIKADGTVKYLSDFRAIVSNNRYGPINYDKSVAGKTITIAGQTFERGFGTECQTEAWFTLDGDYTLLKGYIGIDDEVAGKESGKAALMIVGLKK